MVQAERISGEKKKNDTEEAGLSKNEGTNDLNCDGKGGNDLKMTNLLVEGGLPLFNGHISSYSFNGSKICGEGKQASLRPVIVGRAISDL